MDILGLLNQMDADGSVQSIARNSLAQFGTRTRRYLGATILPERNVPDNVYKEENIRYRSVIANAGTRYSPVQLKKGTLVGSFLVQLADSDIGSEFNGRDYDALLRILGRGADMEAIASITRWLDTTVNIPLIEWNERARWQALVSAVVQLRGDNSYTEDINYSNPAGHRAAAAAAWSNNATDPFVDIYGMAQLLSDKGFTVGRIVTSRKVLGIMAANAIVRTRTNRVTVNTSGQITALSGRVSQAELSAFLAADGLPPIELYDLSYRTSTGTGRFMPDNVMVMVATTGRDEELDLADGRVEVLPDTLGYVGVGRPTGQSDNGRVIRQESFRNKPPRIEAEGWQTSLPVITEPEAVAVITGIA